MLAPRYIQHELSLINPNYFAIFDERIHRWTVRKWKWNFIREDWKRNSEFIRKVSLHDENGNDSGYRPMDMRALYELKKGLYNARRLKYFLREIDEANNKMLRQNDSEQEYIHRDSAKSIWRHYREPSVYLGS